MSDWAGLLFFVAAIFLGTSFLMTDDAPQTECSCAHGHEVTP